MMEGWISIDRRIEKHWIWKNPLYFRAWVYCIMRANHTDTKIEINGQLLQLNRGEFITSRLNFSADNGLSERQTRTLWRLLENDQMIVRKSTKLWTKLIVCNYDHYQDRRPSKRPTDDQVTTTDNNVNNGNKGRDFPSPEMITQYARDNGYDLDGNYIYRYYEDLNFKDTQGNEIRNWKNKLRRVWFKPEHRLNGTPERIKINEWKPPSDE